MMAHEQCLRPTRLLCHASSQRMAVKRLTHHSISHTHDVVTIMTDQIATASICSRRFRGICAGTKLHTETQSSAQSTILLRFHLKARSSAHSTFACNAATGFDTCSGPAASFESASFSVLADSVRAPLPSFSVGSTLLVLVLSLLLFLISPGIALAAGVDITLFYRNFRR